MEYTVGSIADLISGKDTPNKPKVIKKKLPKPVRVAEPDMDISSSPQADKPSKSKKKRKNSSTVEDATDLTVINHELLDGTAQLEAGMEATGAGLVPGKNKRKKLKRKLLTGDQVGEDAENSPAQQQRENKPKTQTDGAELGGLSRRDKRKKLKKNMEKANGDDVEVPNHLKPEVKQEIDSRTLFVGNVATTVKKTQLIRFFGKFGKIKSVRLRCVTPARPGIPKKVAIIKKMLHSKRTTLHSYITFEKREDALKALVLNGTKYKEHYLRVQICNDSSKPEASKAIFVGNLPFDAEDDDLWTAFESLGGISSVRVVRNSVTGMGIGIGFVNFDSADSVELALQMGDVMVKNKQVRIQRYSDGNKKKRRDVMRGQEQHKEPIRKPNLSQGERKRQKGDSVTVNVKNSLFQGNKSTKKKQRAKLNKGSIQKLKLSKKIAPR